MHRQHLLRHSPWARLLLLFGLLIGFGLLAGGLATPAHAASTLTITNCSNDSQLQADVGTANTDNSGDTITFSCNGDITLSSTLSISGSMTLDGNGQSVTLDGGNSVRVLSVNSSVSFSLNALTIAHGSAPGGSDGGGLSNNFGTVSISNSTFANNSGDVGGGLFNGGGGTLSITNSTFANNSAPSGGGLVNSGTANITNSTFANNSATSDGGGLANAGTVSIGGSIVANNTGGNCSNIGSITSTGYNLDSGTGCGFTGTGSLQNTDPKLASALASNGGPTQTLALLDGSPAIDQIPAAQCPATDQRGVSRPDNGETTCDMGAYEFTDPVDHDLGLSGLPANMTVNATSPHGAVVTYTPPTAVDESGDSPAPTVSCTPAPGSTFAIGTTTVTCTATDSDDTNSPVSGSFTVTVKGAAAQVSNLITTVNSFHLTKSLQTSLDNKLKDMLTAIQAGQTATACSELTDFIGFVQSHTGKGLTVSQATQLIAAARQVQAVLGC